METVRELMEAIEEKLQEPKSIDRDFELDEMQADLYLLQFPDDNPINF